jgi:SSS family solute:Na+ symporter
METNAKLLWFIGLYLILMIALGIKYATEAKDSKDFVLAGSGLGVFTLVGTLVASWVGSGAITGGGNSASYASGLWIGVGWLVPTLIGMLFFYFVGPKIRKLGKITVAGIIKERFGTTCAALTSLVLIIAYLAMTSYQMKGFAFVLNITTGLDVTIGTWIACVIIVGLAVMGGLKSVAPTDAWSAVIIVIGLVLAVPFSIKNAGGWSHIVANLPENHLKPMGNADVMYLAGLYIPLLFLMLGDSNLIQRITASKSEKELKKSLKMMVCSSFLIYPVIALLATIAKSVYPDIDPGMATLSTTTFVPLVIGGLLLTGAAAIMLTTGDSTLLGCATSFTYDIYGQFINPEASEQKKFKVIRLSIVAFGAISVICLLFFPSILAIQTYSYTVYSAGITPAVIAALLWKKATKQGVLSAIVVGTALTLVLEFGKLVSIPTGLISIPVSFGILVVVSLITYKEKEQG